MQPFGPFGPLLLTSPKFSMSETCPLLFDLTPFLKSDHCHRWEVGLSPLSMIPTRPMFVTSKFALSELRICRRDRVRAEVLLSSVRKTHVANRAFASQPSSKMLHLVMRRQMRLMTIRGRLKAESEQQLDRGRLTYHNHSLGPDIVLAFRDLLYGHRREKLHTASNQS